MQDKPFFKADELNLAQMDWTWTIDELLDQKQMFLLKDVAGQLSVNSTKIKKRYRQLVQNKKDPYKVMGAKKILNHWLIRMNVFAPYYRKNFQPVKNLPPNLDANGLLALKDGVFSMSKVAALLPVTCEALRYQAKKHRNPRQVTGIFKDPAGKGYLVDMKVFGPYFRTLWENPKSAA